MKTFAANLAPKFFVPGGAVAFRAFVESFNNAIYRGRAIIGYDFDATTAVAKAVAEAGFDVTILGGSTFRAIRAVSAVAS